MSIAIFDYLNFYNVNHICIGYIMKAKVTITLNDEKLEDRAERKILCIL